MLAAVLEQSFSLRAARDGAVGWDLPALEGQRRGGSRTHRLGGKGPAGSFFATHKIHSPSFFSFSSPQAEELLCCLFDSLTSDSTCHIESQSC